MKKLFLFLVVLSAAPLCSDDDFDIEDIAQDFIIEKRQIHIPGYPYAFNPSITRWKGKNLMSFRIITRRPTNTLFSISEDSLIGLIWLDEDFSPIGKPYILPLKEINVYDRSEDARLITVNDQLIITYSSNNNDIVTEGGFRMYVATLDFDGNDFTITHNERLTEFFGENPERREKNWVPFAYEEELYLGYMITPHRILKPLLDGQGKCPTIWTSRGSIVWEWGELRGGTPAFYDEKEGEYIALFHSCSTMATANSFGSEALHYFIGAYTFSSQPPFAITRISPEPIVGKGFYWGKEYRPYWKPVRVVFPGGILCDPEHLWVAYGRQDHEIWMVKIDKKGLLESLIRVSTR